MSRYLLLEEKSSLSELSFDGSFVFVSDMGSVDTSPPSQAMYVTDAAIPSDVANVFFAMDERFMRLSAIFFSIFKTKLLLPLHSL